MGSVIRAARMAGLVLGMGLAAAHPARAEGGLMDGWLVRSPSAQKGAAMPVADPAASADPSGAGADFRQASRILKPNVKVPAGLCDANPSMCLCPRGSFRTAFYDGDGINKPQKHVFMCVDTTCPAGKVLKKHLDQANGSVSFKCVEVR